LPWSGDILLYRSYSAMKMGHLNCYKVGIFSYLCSTTVFQLQTSA